MPLHYFEHYDDNIEIEFLENYEDYPNERLINADWQVYEDLFEIGCGSKLGDDICRNWAKKYG